MTYSFEGKELNSFFGLSTDYPREYEEFASRENLINIIWNRNVEKVSFTIDNIPVELRSNQITTTTFLQTINFPKGTLPLTTFAFNRPFYCIQDHDHEVSCNGILFFGTIEAPIVTLDEIEIGKFDLLYKVFVDEFRTRDNIQGEMLQMLLKRLIIKTTRLAKTQIVPQELETNQIDVIRKFNVLVEMNFRTKKQVAEYADMMHKSPKTLSNLFSKYGSHSPLQIIHDRIIMEAKRLLLYTDKTAKEIAFDLGFEEVASFHKMFKKVAGVTPQQFKAGVAKV